MALPTFVYFYWIFFVLILILHSFVTSFIILQRYRKNKTYISPFYLLYIVLSFIDVICLINSTFYSKIVLIESLHPWMTSHTLYITVCHCISEYTGYSQAIYHAAISINRIWVAFFLMKNGTTITKIGKYGYWLIWFLPILPLIFLSPQMTDKMVYLNTGPGFIFASYNNTFIQKVIVF